MITRPSTTKLLLLSLIVVSSAITGASISFAHYVATGHQSSFFGLLFRVCFSSALAGSFLSAIGAAFAFSCSWVSRRDTKDKALQFIKEETQRHLVSGDTETAAILMGVIESQRGDK